VSFKWGIIGCGQIAPKFFQALENTGEGRVVAAASQSMRRAKRLQQKLGIEHVYGSYAEMLEREKLDAVYIATSHNFHYENAKLCFEHNLPVLIEKAFTRNAAEAEELIDLARMQGLFLMEAMWTRFNPATVKLRKLIAEGAIGERKNLKADFCVKMPPSIKTMPWNRMFSPYLAGGALLDVGVYPIAVAHMIFGRAPSAISGSMEKAWTGVDKSSTYSLDFGPNQRAELSGSFVMQKPREALLTGTAGTIRIPHFSAADQIILTRSGEEPEVIACDAPSFEHEIREVHRCLMEKQLESNRYPLAQTLGVMRTMDAIRLQGGLRYPGE
jgi:predicted dehydrogenase